MSKRHLDQAIKRLRSIRELASADPKYGAIQEHLGRGECRALLEEIERLRAALNPFADLGAAFTKVDTADTSPWATIPDNTRIGLSGWGNVSITVGQLRAAAGALTQGEDGL